MAAPEKPDSFKLKPGERFLKGRKATSSSMTQGVQDKEKNRCEQWAWWRIISIFVGPYDISEWNDDPPIPLNEIWELIASALYLKFVLQRMSTDEGGDIAVQWIQDAQAMMADLLPKRSGKRDRLRRHFIKNDGTIQHPQYDYFNKPVVYTSGITFFPDTDSATSHGLTTFANFESFWRENTLGAPT